MRFNARIPVIPLPYKDKELAVEKEVVIKYGHDDEYPNIYIVDEYDRTKLWDITEGIRQSIQGGPGDDFTVEIDGIGTISLGDILNLLYSISLTHDEAWSIETVKKMIPTTIVDNKGVVYAPRTLSTAVYMESGETIDVRLRSISKVGLAMRHVIASEELQSTFTIPFPFDNYISEGNSFWLYIGSVMVDNRRYHMSEDGIKIIFNDPEDYVEKDRTVTFLFWYNSATPDTGVLLVMDGKYITPGTVETNRLANVSDSIDLNDPSAIASARAVCTLRNVVNERIDSLSGNLSVTCLAHESSTATELVVKIPNYTLTDSNMIHIRLREDLGPNATLQVNDEPAMPIYNGNNRVEAGPLAGEIINVSFSSLENRFYIYGVSTFRLETTLYHNSPEEGSSEIPFNLSYNPLMDKLDIYYNGIKLFPDIHFTLNEQSISLLDFTSETGDLFTFELTQIVPVKK